MLSNDLKKKAQPRELGLAIVVILALCFMMYTLLVTPKKKKLVEINEQLTKVNDEITTTQKENDELRRKQDEQRRLEKEQFVPKEISASKNPRVQMIQGKIKPDYEDLTQFLNALTRPEFRMSLEIQSLSYNDPKKENGYYSMAFSIVARGQFGTTVDFIHKLEDAKALVAIDKININVDKKDGKFVTLELVGSFYKLMEDSNG